MTKHSKLTLALLLSALIPLVANAQLAANYHRLPITPKVVFLGDYLTYEWAGAFAANPNWINQGNPSVYGGGSSDALARFQSDVVSLRPAIVHIMVGAFDAEVTTPEGEPFTVPQFVTNLDAMVKEAKAANINVVLGMEPATGSFNYPFWQQINAAIAGSSGVRQKRP
jgi:lysophospholipase L1-like esterase